MGKKLLSGPAIQVDVFQVALGMIENRIPLIEEICKRGKSRDGFRTLILFYD
jgi:hypothetical protein